MKTLIQFFDSTLGKKLVMGITGLLLFGFVIFHMIGNLQVFMGPEALNKYAHFLKSKSLIVWGGRFWLLALVIMHIYSAIRLTKENRAARGNEPYLEAKPHKATYSSRTMMMSGLIVLAFIIYHLLHFTVLFTNPEFAEFHDEKGRHDVYRMVVVGFSSPIVAFFYITGMALLCMHLNHGVNSLFQTLGLRNQQTRKWIDCFSGGAAWVLFLGNISIPLAVLAGWIKLAGS
ncbi:MAG TPA: succinate dehydrogenase cytochrome b subunit [Verrucomicrobiales bacterium]|nr:succinate dehydrogenase cytochrome b subunit [Verrucomicrobiales bacterium]HIL69801.1 succinate dehydrogenase cytochrome b subunit [Verrucomicrobiota bacterium]